MAVYEFKFETLHRLDDGRVCEAFNQAIRRAVLDCEDRPAETKTRKVVLQCELKPVCDDRGELTDVAFLFQVKDSVPTRKSKVYRGAYRKTGGTNLVFNDLSDEDPGQGTLDRENPEAWE